MRVVALALLTALLVVTAVIAMAGATFGQCTLYFALGLVLLFSNASVVTGMAARLVLAYLGVAWLVSAWNQAPAYWMACGTLLPLSMLAAAACWFGSGGGRESAGRPLALAAVLAGLGTAIALFLIPGALAFIGAPSLMELGPHRAASPVLAACALVIAIAVAPAWPVWLPRLVGAWSLCLGLWAALSIIPACSLLIEGWTALNGGSSKYALWVFEKNRPALPAWPAHLEAVKQAELATAAFRLGQINKAVEAWRKAEPVSARWTSPFTTAYLRLLAQGAQLPTDRKNPYRALVLDPDQQRALVLKTNGELVIVGQEITAAPLHVDGVTQAVDCELAANGQLYILWAGGLISWHDPVTFAVLGMDKNFIPGATKLLVFGACDLAMPPSQATSEAPLYYALGPYGECYSNGSLPAQEVTKAFHLLLHFGNRPSTKGDWQGIARRIAPAPDGQRLTLTTLRGQVWPFAVSQAAGGEYQFNLVTAQALNEINLMPLDECTDFVAVNHDPLCGFALWNNGVIQPMGPVPCFERGLVMPKLDPGEEAVCLRYDASHQRFYVLTQQGRVFTNVGPAGEIMACAGER